MNNFPGKQKRVFISQDTIFSFVLNLRPLYSLLPKDETTGYILNEKSQELANIISQKYQDIFLIDEEILDVEVGMNVYYLLKQISKIYIDSLENNKDNKKIFEEIDLIIKDIISNHEYYEKHEKYSKMKLQLLNFNIEYRIMDFKKSLIEKEVNLLAGKFVINKSFKLRQEVSEKMRILREEHKIIKDSITKIEGIINELTEKCNLFVHSFK